jgi:chaperonin GroES
MSRLGFRAFGERIIVVRDPSFLSDIILQPTEQEFQLSQGSVVSVGDGYMLDDGKILPMRIKVGDRIVFGKFSGSSFTLNGKTYQSLAETDIQCWIDDAEPSQP